MDTEVRRTTNKGNNTTCPAVRVHKDEVRLDRYKHVTTGFDDELEYVDATCFSFNTTRPYCYVRMVVSSSE